MSQDINKMMSSVWKVRDEGQKLEVKWKEAIERIMAGDLSYLPMFTMKRITNGFLLGSK